MADHKRPEINEVLFTIDGAVVKTVLTEAPIHDIIEGMITGGEQIRAQQNEGR